MPFVQAAAVLVLQSLSGRLAKDSKRLKFPKTSQGFEQFCFILVPKDAADFAADLAAGLQSEEVSVRPGT